MLKNLTQSLKNERPLKGMKEQGLSGPLIKCQTHDWVSGRDQISESFLKSQCAFGDAPYLSLFLLRHLFSLLHKQKHNKGYTVSILRDLFNAANFGRPVKGLKVLNM